MIPCHFPCGDISGFQKLEYYQKEDEIKLSNLVALENVRNIKCRIIVEHTSLYFGRKWPLLNATSFFIGALYSTVCCIHEPFFVLVA